MLDDAAYNSKAQKTTQQPQNFLSVLSKVLCKPLIGRRFLAEQTKQVVVCMGALMSEQMAGPSHHQP